MEVSGYRQQVAQAYVAQHTGRREALDQVRAIFT